MLRYELLSLLVALIAVVISLVSLTKTHRLARRQLELQEEQAALSRLQHEVLAEEQEQKQHADLRVSLVAVGTARKFIFANAGPGTAREVDFAFAGAERVVIPAQYSAVFPIKEFRPGHEVQLTAVLTLQTPSAFDGIFTWVDESGRHREQRCKITL